MDHNEAVQQKATERYLLNELDPEVRDQFEEHLFECQECAVDLRAAAMFVEQSKIVLAEEPSVAPARVPVPHQEKAGWLAWLRPAFAVPVLALLLAVIGYQNFVTYPHLMEASNRPQMGPWASINVGTRGATTTMVKAHRGEDFDLLVSIPPDALYASYSLDLYTPAGKLQWSLQIPATSPDDTRSIHVPGNRLESGTYKVEVTGVSATGQSSSLGTYPVELQVQK